MLYKFDKHAYFYVMLAFERAYVIYDNVDSKNEYSYQMHVYGNIKVSYIIVYLSIIKYWKRK